MNCYECGKVMVKKHGDIEINRPEIDKFIAKNILYMACDNCGSKIILPNYSKRINKEALKIQVTKIMKSKKRLSIFELVKEANNNDLINEVIKDLVKESIIKETKDRNNIRILIYIEETNEISWVKRLFNKYLK